MKKRSQPSVLNCHDDLSRATALEIGGGTRPFPVPTGAKVPYGDIRDPVSLKSYFKADAVQSGEPIDAQTLAGIADASLDFVISAHVIEHLRDPIGAIVNAIRVLEHGGIHLLVVPDMRRTFDRDRPETSVAHVLADFSDGGIGTCRDGYEEHLRYVHPILTGQRYSEAEIQRQATEAARLWPKYGAHFHAWTQAGFEALLHAASDLVPANLAEDYGRIAQHQVRQFAITEMYRLKRGGAPA